MDLSALTLQQLRYLVALERHRNFRDAADAAHVSQPALSMQVKRLEEVLGVSVFDRSRQPVVMTEKGERVVAQAKIVLEHFERLGNIVDPKQELSGAYRLAVIPTLAATFVPLVLARFAQAYPKVTLEVVEAPTMTLLRGLREGAFDGGLAATPLDAAGVHEKIVCHERLFAYLPPGHALLARTRLHQADLVDEHVWLLSEGHCFRTQVLHLCGADRRREIGQGSGVRYDGSTFEALVGIVDTGFGATVLPELVVRGLPALRAARVRPFVTPEPVREIGFLSTRSHANADIADAIFQLLRAVVPPDLVGREPTKGSIMKPMKVPGEKRRRSRTKRRPRRLVSA